MKLKFATITAAVLAAFAPLPGVSASPIPAKLNSGPLSVWTTAARGWIGMITPFTTTEDSAQRKVPASRRVKYSGDGTVAQQWPDQSEWKTFEELWDTNKDAYIDKQDNKPAETEDLHDAILDVANQTAVDARYILVVVIQESKGRVRVGGTSSWQGIGNPGLMQAYGGYAKGSCATVGLKSRCPYSEIKQMIEDGTASNPEGQDLKDLIDTAGVTDVSKYYLAARKYNSGQYSIAKKGDLSNPADKATPSYVSDIANRLMGLTW